MRTRAETTSGDFSFGAGQGNYYINIPLTVGQIVQTTLQLIQGEWYLDTTQGTPYFTSIMGKNPQAVADLTIQNTVLQVNGVVSIAAFSSSIDADTRAYSAQITINTIYGQTEIEIEYPSIMPIVNPVLIPELITQSGFVIATQQGEPIAS